MSLCRMNVTEYMRLILYFFTSKRSFPLFFFCTFFFNKNYKITEIKHASIHDKIESNTKHIHVLVGDGSESELRGD